MCIPTGLHGVAADGNNLATICILKLFIALHYPQKRGKNCSCIFVLELITSLAELHVTNQ